MVTIKDNISRPLYILDGQTRLHPYTYEEVDNNYEYPYPKHDISFNQIFIFVIFIFAIIILSIFCILIYV